MSENFKKRLKSFAWRLAGMIAVVILNELSKESINLGFGSQSTVVLGLIFSEITKYLNKELK